MDFHGQELESRSPESRDISDLTLFTLWSCLGPISLLAGRGLARVIPWEVIIPVVTRFSQSRVEQESVRIVTESGDYAGFAVWFSLACLILAFARRARFDEKNQSRLMVHVKNLIAKPTFAFGILFINLAAVHPWRVESFGDQLFIGFGLGTAAIGVLVARTIGLLPVEKLKDLQAEIIESRSAQLVAWLGVTILAMVQILIPYDNRHEQIYLNEVAAPLVGLRPLFDFWPTYSNLLGYPIAALVQVFGLSSSTLILSLYWALLGSACWLLSIEIIREVLRWRRVWAGSLAVLLLSITASASNPSPGFPVAGGNLRVTLSILSFYCFLKVLKKENPKLSKLVLLGVLSGLTIVNNTEFGLTSVIAVLSGVVIWTLSGGLHKRIFVVLFVSCAATTTILLLVMGGGNITSSVSSYFLWSTSRLSGGYVEAVPLAGVHIFATVCHGLAALLGWRVARSKDLVNEMRLLGVFGLAASIWGGLTLPYYLGNPTPTFGGPLWLPLAFSLISLVANSRLGFSLIGYSEARKSRNLATNGVSGIQQVVVAFLVCALTTLPNVQVALDKWMDGGWNFDRATSLEEDPVIQELRSNRPSNTGTDVYGYYGEYANLVELLLDIPAVYGVHDPMAVYSSRATIDATCRTLVARRPSIVLVSTRYLPEQFKNPNMREGPCPGMRRVDSADEKLLIKYAYTPSD